MEWVSKVNPGGSSAGNTLLSLAEEGIIQSREGEDGTKSRTTTNPMLIGDMTKGTLVVRSVLTL